MKYIIDVPDTDDYKIYSPLNGLELGLPWKIMDKTYTLPTRIKLEPYTEPDRKAIEDEVWEFVRICLVMDGSDFVDAFDSCSYINLLEYSYQEAKDKYEEWLKQKEEIHVGDEVIPIDVNYDTMIVTRIWIDDHSRDCLDTLGLDGSICSFLTSNVKKTGRHFPEVSKLLEKMRSEEGGQ